jgi:uncharacterized protein YoxC
MDMLFTLAPLQNTVATGDGLAMAADIATIVVGIAIVVVAIAGVALARKMNRMLDGVRTAVNQNLGPVSERARAISDNVEFISHALRTDVERLNSSVRALSNRLHQAADRMEERIEDFNALMEVVQEEAEGMFIDTAATVRGVREGAAAITRRVSAVASEGDETGDIPDATDETLQVDGLDAADEAPQGDDLETMPTQEG